MPRGFEHSLGKDLAVCDDHREVGAKGLQLRDLFGRRIFSGWSTGSPSPWAASLIGEGRSFMSRPAGRSGCVYTATTSCPAATRARSDGAPISPVPMKTILNCDIAV